MTDPRTVELLARTPKVFPHHVIEFANGERCTWEGLREGEVIRRMQERGVAQDELCEASLLIFENFGWSMR